MIDIGKILKRAWHILWNYKVLWIFGILLALTAGGGGGANGSSYQFSGDTGQPPFGPDTYHPGPMWDEFNTWYEQNVAPLFQNPDQHVSTFIWIGVAFLVFILIVAVILTFIRYPSETAILRMVDEYEQTGAKVGFKQGWKLGWSRRAFRIWVIDLIISLPAILFVAMIIGLGVLFFNSVINGDSGMAAAGSIAAIGCAFLFFFAFIILMVFLSLLRQFFVRAAALEETRVGESFRRGWAMFKRNWKSAALMWLVMLGIGIGFGIVSMIVFFLLIPVYVILLIPAVIVAAIPGLIVFGIASLFTSAILAGIIGLVIALPFFFTVLFAPLALISGWYMIYESSVWTLTYREIKALEGLAPEAAVEVPAQTT
ncbi:MAG: hypothetical protein AB1531_02505 [Chloroflexota bacterium]